MVASDRQPSLPLTRCYHSRKREFTRKNAQVVTDLQTSCIARLLSSRYQDVFALLVPSCCDKSGTKSCYNVDDGNRLVTSCSNKTTRVKISHLVASLPTSRQQVVFALLVSSCQQFWNKLLTTCNNLVDIIRLVARLFQQVRYSHDITILLQLCVVNLGTFLLYHDCIRLVRTTL